MFAVIGAAAVVGIAVGVGIRVTQHKAETARLCEVASSAVTATQKQLDDAAEASATALESSVDAVIQDVVRGAKAYSERTAIEADAKKDVQPRESAAELVSAVESAHDDVEAQALVGTCESRRDAEQLTQSSDEALDRIDALETATAAEAAAAEAAAAAQAQHQSIPPGNSGGGWIGGGGGSAGGGASSGGGSSGGGWTPPVIPTQPCEATGTCENPNI